MHWGHAKTRDFLHWEYLPAVLAPDKDYDKDGCFSGGAIELPDGRHLLIYTGVSVHDGRMTQTQCLAIGDGIDYEKLPENPVITTADIPEGGSVRDFRDPKLWRDGDGQYYIGDMLSRGFYKKYATQNNRWRIDDLDSIRKWW